MTPEAVLTKSKAEARQEAKRAMKSFEEEYAKLNDAQKKAVDTIEGPVMVIAGPGTGKTQTISMRVANILRKTQMRPGNILCLTFSVSGAVSMRDRMRSLIGPDAYGINVRTIHGFCQDIINDHPVLFDEWSAEQQITDIERYRMINGIVDQLLPDLAIVNPKNPYARARDLLDRISLMKREGKSYADLVKVAEEYDVQMSEKSKPGTKAHEKNMLAARKFREFTKIFDLYQEMLGKTSRYDYDDMILFVIRALQKEEWMLASLQERYQYILVDEFQDTNGSQNKVIELLTTYPDLGVDPNLFIVGDDDQAIYRFQGANLTNILGFHERFPKCTIITLTENYRSTQSILDAAGRLISKNTERLIGRIDGLSKDLTAANGEHGEEPFLIRAPSDMAEPWLLADLIQERIERGTPLEEIAVITQTNSELRPIYDVLTSRGIPVRMSGKADLLSHPLVMQTIAILRAVQNPEKSSLLADAISSMCFGCPAADLARLYHVHRESKKPLLDVLLSLDSHESMAQGFTLKAHDDIIRIRDLFLDLHQKIATRTVLETVERVLHDCGLIPKDAAIHPLDLAALQEFFDRVRSRMIEQPAFKFDDLMRDLDLFCNPDYSQLRISYDLPHLVTEGIQLMTAHQSKGKEFDVVFLVNFREGHWDKRRSPGSLSIPEDLLFGWEKDQKEFEKHQDERRVAFVAMTRARKELILTCPRELTAGERSKEVAPSAFFAEAGPMTELEGGLREPEKASTLLLTPQRDMDNELKDFLQERLQAFSLSASALNRFLEDPMHFLRIDLLQVPQLSEYALAYGNAVHWALREWGLRMQKGMPMSSEEFLAEFRNFLIEREFLQDGELKRLLYLGEGSLPRYFESRLQKSSPYIERIEGTFVTRLGDIPLKGKIDRIDRDHPEAAAGVVIDYKTGRPQTEGQIRDGDYFRQLQFYAVLLETSLPSLEPRAFVLDFIGEREEHPIERSFQITDAEKEDMRKLIRDVWGKIEALDFTGL